MYLSKLRHIAWPIAAVPVSLAILSPSAGAQTAVNHLNSSNGGVEPGVGLSINQRLGANTLYNLGYTGTRSIMATIEAGLPWNGHETLGHQTTHLFAPGFSGSQLGQFDRHATWVAHIMGGRINPADSQEYQRGIAYGAALWAGAIATSWGSAAYALNFSWSNNNAFLNPYQTAMLSGVQGSTADVINSSFGFSDSAASSNIARALDGMLYQSKKIMTASAGNTGPSINTVGAPATAYNVISVGSSASDTSNPSYSSLSSFSSRSPSNYSGPDGSFQGVRAKVDLLAPGQNLTLAHYGGQTGGNWNGSHTGGGPGHYNTNVWGTSFSAPTVAGGAALLVDVGKDRFAGGNSIDSRTIKSILQTSAEKFGDWGNGMTLQGDGSYFTSQALDYGQGAGQMDLTNAFNVYTNGTTDLTGTGGGTIDEVGWDVGSVSASSGNQYFFAEQLQGGSKLTATLNWFVHRDFQGIDEAGNITAPDLAFSDLSLELFSVTSGSLGNLLARSDAKFLNVEHFAFELPETGFYALQVNYLGKRYNLGNAGAFEEYALSWSAMAAPVPEPATMAALGLGLAAVLRRRRKA